MLIIEKTERFQKPLRFLFDLLYFHNFVNPFLFLGLKLPVIFIYILEDNL